MPNSARADSVTMSWRLLGLLLSGTLLVACSSEMSRIELLRSNPMANPTLSFTEPAGQTSVEGADAGLFGAPAQTIHTTRFEVPEDKIEQAKSELFAQATAAGFQLEFIGHEDGLPYGTWQGRDPTSAQLTLIVTPFGAQVELR